MDVMKILQYNKSACGITAYAELNNIASKFIWEKQSSNFLPVLSRKSTVCVFKKSYKLSKALFRKKLKV